MLAFVDPSDAVQTEINVSSGSLRRCPHGVYCPDRSSKAPYCLGCFPDGPPFKTQNVVLPHSSGDPIDGHRLLANKKSPHRCPACNSPLYVKLENRMRRCAECKKKYPTPRRYDD